MAIVNTRSRRPPTAGRATRTITTVIPQGAGGFWYEMDACLHGPGIPSERAEITSMLKTVRLTPGS